MTDSVKPARPATGPVIVFQPVTVRSGPLWQALSIAKTALMVWGAVSLVGSSGLALAYAGGAFEPDQTRAMERALTETTPAQAPSPDPAPAPRAEAARAADPIQTGSISRPPAPDASGLARLRPVSPVPPVGLAAGVMASPEVPPPANADAEEAETAVARLPQPRPERPTIVRGALPRHYADRGEQRFRRLSDLRLPYTAERRLRVLRRHRAWPRPIQPEIYDW